MEKLKNLPENIRIYIQEIAERMSQGRAVVMIGSGFSKNARNNRYTEKKFLDWNQLGDIFYKKLYGKSPKDEETPCYYQNALKLAEKVQQCFGRITLDELISNNLPDEEYEPSKLHEMLLKLNWTDIFTTNYDTLLERTRSRVFNTRYQVVLTKEDLVYSKCPRIIKLHGSFPSIRPFIITEEDYRKYPQDFAVFVNTVRQALIENVMCMIGFSGDDPNFLNWIGWIRDCFGNEAASKIYMVGMFDVKEIDRKLYDSRNIILINMKECPGMEYAQYADGLKLFFEAIDFFQRREEEDKFLRNKEKKVRIEEVYCRAAILLKKRPADFLNELNDGIEKITKEWFEEREDDIDWFVVPYQRRQSIEKTMEFGGALVKLLNKCELLENITDTVGAFLYEYNWRRERCFLPLKPSMAKTYVEYLFHSEKIWNEKDIELCFSLLEYWRECGDFEQWQIMMEKLKYKINSEQRKKLYCEKAMKMLYSLECGDLANILIDLTDSVHRAGLEFKVSSLLAELGYYERAILLLKKNLDAVRKQMGNDIDYRNFSREAYLIDLLENLEKYDDYITGNIDTKKDMDSHSRLKTLKSYDCNPEYEKDYLIQKVVSYIHSGKEKYKLVEGAEPEQYIKFMERTGMVFRAVYFFRYADEFPVLLKGMVQTNPYFALLCTFRYGEKAICDQIWNEKTMENMGMDMADRLIHRCIKACEENENYLRSDKVKENNLAFKLPELTPCIITALIKKASVDGNYSVMRFISRILKRANQNFSGIEIGEMLQACVMQLSTLQPSNLLEQWITFPLGCQIGNETNDILEPFLYMDITISGINIPNEEQMDALKCLGENVPNCKWALYARLLAIEIICDTGSMENKILLEAKNEETKAPNGFSEIIACYETKYGDEEKRIQEKEKWLERLTCQVGTLSEKGVKYCANFRIEIEKLLKRIRFYRTKCDGFKWNAKELDQIVENLAKWADVINNIIWPLCNEIEYYDSWCILEMILLEAIWPDIIELRQGNEKKLQMLEKKLVKLGIPFLLRQIILQQKVVKRDNIHKLLLTASMKGEREREEVKRILLLFPDMLSG